RQGSLCEDYSAIECGAYLFGGWRDGYTNCNLRTFENLRRPMKVLVGRWLRVAPDVGIPGPGLDHVREMAGFCQSGLKGADDGIMDEPPVTVYMQEYDEPAAERALTSGSWRSEREWPIADSHTATYYLGAEQQLLSDAPKAERTTQYAYHPSVGTTFGMFSA